MLLLLQVVLCDLELVFERADRILERCDFVLEQVSLLDGLLTQNLILGFQLLAERFLLIQVNLDLVDSG